MNFHSIRTVDDPHVCAGVESVLDVQPNTFSPSFRNARLGLVAQARDLATDHKLLNSL
jgi:hypothetical protein